MIVFAKTASARVQLLLLAAASTGLAPGYKTSCPHSVLQEPSIILMYCVGYLYSIINETVITVTSGVLEHKWRASLKTILFLLTSNTEATENKV